MLPERTAKGASGLPLFYRTEEEKARAFGNYFRKTEAFSDGFPSPHVSDSGPARRAPGTQPLFLLFPKKVLDKPKTVWYNTKAFERTAKSNMRVWRNEPLCGEARTLAFFGEYCEAIRPQTRASFNNLICGYGGTSRFAAKEERLRSSGSIAKQYDRRRAHHSTI